MKILAVTWLFLPSIWWYQFSTHQTLLELHNLWVDVTLIASEFDWDLDFDNNCPYKVLRKWTANYKWCISQIFYTNKIYKSWDYDYVVLMWHYPETAYWLFSYFLWFKLITLAAWTRLRFPAPKWKSMLWKILLWNCYRKSEHIISISLQTKKQIIEDSNVNENNFTIIPRPIDKDIWWKLSEKNKNEIFTILTVSRLEEQKNIDDVLEIVYRLKMKWYNIKYKIAWAWNYKERIEEIIKDKWLTGNVELLWNLDELSLRKEYRNTDLFILLSKAQKCWNTFLGESFWRIYLESFSQKTAVIWFWVWWPIEIIDDWINWFLFQDGELDNIVNKVIYLINNNDFLIELWNNWRKKFEENYSSDIVWKKILDTLTKLKNGEI